MSAARLCAAFVLAAAGAIAAASQASADHGAPTPTHTHIEIAPMVPSVVMGVPVEGEYVLSARLLMDDGGALAYQPVRFYEQVELFGEREALLGESYTDSGGVATLKYRPAVAGERLIVVRYAGDRAHDGSSIRLTVQVPQAKAAYERQPLPFAALQPWLPVGVGLLVLSVWLVLVIAFVRTLIHVRREGAVP